MSVIVNCKSKDFSYVQRNSLTVSYFDDIRSYPVLSSREERKLLERTKSNNPVIATKARQRLIECNQRFVASVAKHWQNGDNLMDLINEGNIGLMHAIDNFDLNKKHRLITYAVWWIRKYINEYVIFKEKAIVPAGALKLYTYVPKVRNNFYAENHRLPTFEETKEILKKKYNVSVPHDEDLEILSYAHIDDVYFEPNENALSNDNVMFENVTSSNNIEEETDRADLCKSVRNLLQYLTDREKKIIKLFYGIDCHERGLVSISEEMGLSVERIRQIINSSLKKMHKKANLINEY